MLFSVSLVILLSFGGLEIYFAKLIFVDKERYTFLLINPRLLS